MTFTYRHRKQIILALFLFCLLVLGLVFLFQSGFQKKTKKENTPVVLSAKKKEEKEEKSSSVEKEEVYFQVDVKGEVMNPGIYSVTEGSRVIDVIRLAGDLTVNADTSVLNLSKKVKDEMVIVVYSKREVEDFTKTKETEEQQQEACVKPSEEALENDACIKDSTTEEKKEQSSVVIEGKLSLNTATLEELMTLSGIGEAKAKAILKKSKM